MRQRPSYGGDSSLYVQLADDQPTTADRTRTDGPSRVPVNRVRRRRVAWLLASVATVAAVVVVNVVDARRDELRLRALADVPGITASLAGPLEQIWRVDGSFVGHVDGLMIVTDALTGARTAIDVATGTVLWTSEAPGPGTGESCSAASQDGTTGPTVVLCVAPVPEDRFSGTSGGAVVSAVDASTGATVALHRVGRPVLDFSVMGRDVVLLTVEADGHLGALRWSADADEVLWATTSQDRTDLDPARFSTEWSSRVLSAFSGTQFSVDLLTGQELPARYVNDVRWLDVQHHDLPDGRALEWSDVSEYEVVPVVTRVLAQDGTVLHSVVGKTWLPGVDDGSAGGTLLTHDSSTDDTLRAFDLATGERMWSRPVPVDARPVHLVGRMLVTVEGTSAVARDVRTGDVRWTQDGIEGFLPLTDGEFVLLQQSTEGRAGLAAHRLDDGTRTWAGELPFGTRDVFAVRGGAVVAVLDAGVVGLG
jgi:outer membrane protein assembly factor BamB